MRGQENAHRVVVCRLEMVVVWRLEIYRHCLINVGINRKTILKLFLENSVETE